MIGFEGAKYEICGDSTALLYGVTSSCAHFVVPSEVFSSDDRRFKVIGISKETKVISEARIDVISFDESTKIEMIPLHFVLSRVESFIIPESIKRVVDDKFVIARNPKIIADDRNKFVSVICERNIVNNHPLESISIKCCPSRLYIRETTRIIGSRAFNNNKKN